VERAPVPEGLAGDGPDFPDVSEVDVVRHYTRLSQWNFSVDTGMYPLGSCTMKYNPKTNERQAAVPGFAHAHPLLPAALCQGGLELMAALECLLAEITGMDAVTLQPGAGPTGAAGMLIFHAAQHRGKPAPRSSCPTRHHPASAALCGYAAVPVASARGARAGNLAAVMDEDTAGIMVTNPNTLGLFEENIKAVADIVHARGGLVYGDGANMNAVMGLVNMSEIGIDVLHLNLHKTFSTPHGGGGPGAGPVCVRRHLSRSSRSWGTPGQHGQSHPGLQLHPEPGRRNLKRVSEWRC
jgi:glycine dehydrogenase subunit 2